MKKNNLKGWLYLLPAILFLGCFMVYPLVDVLVYSFEEGYNFASQTYYGVGLYNYSRVLHDPYFLQAVKNTFLLVVITVPLSTGIALIGSQFVVLCRFLIALRNAESSLITEAEIIICCWKLMFRCHLQISDALFFVFVLIRGEQIDVSEHVLTIRFSLIGIGLQNFYGLLHILLYAFSISVARGKTAYSRAIPLISGKLIVFFSFFVILIYAKSQFITESKPMLCHGIPRLRRLLYDRKGGFIVFGFHQGRCLFDQAGCIRRFLCRVFLGFRRRLKRQNEQQHAQGNHQGQCFFHYGFPFRIFV